MKTCRGTAQRVAHSLCPGPGTVLSAPSSDFIHGFPCTGGRYCSWLMRLPPVVAVTIILLSGFSHAYTSTVSTPTTVHSRRRIPSILENHVINRHTVHSHCDYYQKCCWRQSSQLNFLIYFTMLF